MELHQFLRFVTYGTPVRIFDIQGVEICKVTSKENIDIDLYEYSILEITSGIVDFNRDIYGILITLQK